MVYMCLDGISDLYTVGRCKRKSDVDENLVKKLPKTWH